MYTRFAWAYGPYLTIFDLLTAHSSQPYHIFDSTTAPLMRLVLFVLATAVTLYLALCVCKQMYALVASVSCPQWYTIGVCKRGQLSGLRLTTSSFELLLSI